LRMRIKKGKISPPPKKNKKLSQKNRKNFKIRYR
jgi:hypothetical protein